jgi:hypothetical protein
MLGKVNDERNSTYAGEAQGSTFVVILSGREGTVAPKKVPPLPRFCWQLTDAPNPPESWAQVQPASNKGSNRSHIVRSEVRVELWFEL